MPYAANPEDGVRTYFEDWGGTGSAVLVYSGLADPLEQAQDTPLVRALVADHRMIFADHRGHGRSDKPHREDDYALLARVADAVAVLDELSLDRVHILGFSWGARLGFGIGEHAADRVLSLVLCGNQPYRWDPEWRFVQQLTAALNTASEHGMEGFLKVLEALGNKPVKDPIRGWILANDPVAIGAAWRSAMVEGAVSADLSDWRVPCLIYMAEGEEMYANAVRAADVIPGAKFLTLRGHTHLSASEEVDQVLPEVRAFLQAAADK